MSEYNKTISKIYDPLLHFAVIRLRKKIVEVSKELKADKIIDLCCGTGNQLKQFKKQGFKNVVGVDLSETMIAESSKGKYKTKCLHEDATNTSLEDSSFDIVTITLALHEKSFDVISGILIEAKRLLNPTGHLLVADYCFDEKTFLIGRLGTKTVEKFAGGDHYRNFKNYIKNGGLNFIMNDKKYISEYPFIFKSVRLRTFPYQEL